MSTPTPTALQRTVNPNPNGFQVAEENICDVIIDARQPILLSILSWADQAWPRAAKTRY